VSEPDLADYEFKAPGGTDFMWLAVTTELAPKALAKTPHMLASSS
jgi:hypothetical protein